MRPDYLNEYRKLRDAFRQAQKGGCANINKSLNKDSFNANWHSSIDDEAPSIGSSFLATSPKTKYPSTPPEDISSFETVSNAIREASTNAYAPSRSARKGGAASQLAVTSLSEIYPENRPRKGHKKSRGGCFTCKKRKIKCQENQPVCNNCTRKKLNCEYPAPKTLSALRSSSLYSPSPVTLVNLQSTPTVFTLTDMRLFHHYLLDAYPHLPVGNESAWLSQIPLIAHHNQYLMHAILGTAASHIELLTGTNLTSTALHHRILAIHGSSKALTQTNRAGSDGDALLAACYLLTFQSSYMKDGITEFFHFVRGCSLVSNQLREERLAMAFFLTSEDHFEFMEGRLTDLAVVDEGVLGGAEESLGAVRGSLELEVHFLIFGLLSDCVAAIRTSSLEGYFKFLSIYQAINHLDNQSFADFSSPTNHISRILIGHFFAIQLIMLPILDREWGGRSKTTPYRMNLDWVSRINEGLPKNLRRFIEWPSAVAEGVSAVRAKDSRVLGLRKKNGKK